MLPGAVCSPLVSSFPVLRRFSQLFGALRGAFRHFFYWLQKATLGTGLALNASWGRLQSCGRQLPGLSAPFVAFGDNARCLQTFFTLGTCLAFYTSRGRLQSFGQQLPGPPALFHTFFYWLQKATLGTGLALNASPGRLQSCGRQLPGLSAPFVAFGDNARRLHTSFLLAPKSNNTTIGTPTIQPNVAGWPSNVAAWESPLVCFFLEGS